MCQLGYLGGPIPIQKNSNLGAPRLVAGPRLEDRGVVCVAARPARRAAWRDLGTPWDLGKGKGGKSLVVKAIIYHGYKCYIMLLRSIMVRNGY